MFRGKIKTWIPNNCSGKTTRNDAENFNANFLSNFLCDLGKKQQFRGH